MSLDTEHNFTNKAEEQVSPADGTSDAEQGDLLHVAPGSAKAFFTNPDKLLSIGEPGCYYAWIFLVCFTPIMFGNDSVSQAAYTTQLLASLGGYLGVLVYRIVGSSFRIPIPRCNVVLWSVLASLGTAATVGTYIFFAQSAYAMPLIAVASGVAGVCLALIHVYWIAQYAQSQPEEAPYRIAGFLLVSFVLCLIGVLLPVQAAVVFISLLPFGCGISVERSNLLDDISKKPSVVTPSKEPSYRLPGAFVFGLISMGLVYGLAQDFALVYWHGGEVAIDCMLASGMVGVILLIYTIRSGKNFGYSTWCLIIVPLAGLAQGMIAIYRVDLLPLSFFLMRTAYVFFDAILWLQLPQAFKKVGSIKVYLVVRLLFEGSICVGVLLHKALMQFDFLFYDAISLAGLVLLIAALTWAFASDSVGTVWNLMPPTTQYTGKFRRACRSIEEEYGLTKRESEVLELVLRGRSGPYIEEKLFISKNTFQTHMRNVYAKIDIHSQQDLLDLLEARLDENRAKERS